MQLRSYFYFYAKHTKKSTKEHNTFTKMSQSIAATSHTIVDSKPMSDTWGRDNMAKTSAASSRRT